MSQSPEQLARNCAVEYDLHCEAIDYSDIEKLIKMITELLTAHDAEVRAETLEMAADVSKRHDQLLIHAFNMVKDEPPVHEQILSLSPDPHYRERIELEARIAEAYPAPDGGLLHLAASRQSRVDFLKDKLAALDTPKGE